MSNRISKLAAALIAVSLGACAPGEQALETAPGDDGFISGRVVGPDGPEAGVWVVAETDAIGDGMAKIVVTDDSGQFVLPELPDGEYRVWARGYGLRDSEAKVTQVGAQLEISIDKAASEAEAAEIYPAGHWLSLINVPGRDLFPGTGADGNGISEGMPTQENFVVHLVENCQICHQVGTRITRELPVEDAQMHEAWKMRIQRQRGPDDSFFEGDDGHLKRNYAVRMTNVMELFGEEAGLDMFSDWTARIRDGATPEAPRRPVGVERNVVMTLWHRPDERFIHDSSSTDKRDPTVNPGGKIYGYGTYSGMLTAFDPATGQERQFKLLDAEGKHAKNSMPHTGKMDAHGRVWMTNVTHLGTYDLEIGGFGQVGPNPGFCSGDNAFASYFPHEAQEVRIATVFDPRTETNQFISTCFGTHHLAFDNNGRLYFSGDTEVVGWLETEKWEPGTPADPSGTMGWCPLVLDTNGDGVITPDRHQWNAVLDGIEGGEGALLRVEKPKERASLDPGKDTRMAGFNYGVGVSPKDQSYWGARYSPYVPSGLFRLETGANPPSTCKTEYYEAPVVDGKPLAFNARSVDIDNDGVAWVAFGSGAIGRFDRSACKVVNGPTATGQHCAEGWEIIPTPGPRLGGTDVGSDWFYEVFVDNHDVFGLGAGTPYFANSSGDEILAYLPGKKDFVSLRIPYPLSFYARGLDGRIDNAQGGWKSRALWVTNNLIPQWHQERGEGSTASVLKIQLRPSPLDR